MTPRYMQLVAIRAQIDALLAAEEQEIASRQPPADPNACPKCGAPEEKQAKAPSMAGTTIACRACGYTRTAASAPQSVS